MNINAAEGRIDLKQGAKDLYVRQYRRSGILGRMISIGNRGAGSPVGFDRGVNPRALG